MTKKDLLLMIGKYDDDLPIYIINEDGDEEEAGKVRFREFDWDLSSCCYAEVYVMEQDPICSGCRHKILDDPIPDRIMIL